MKNITALQFVFALGFKLPCQLPTSSASSVQHFWLRQGPLIAQVQDMRAPFVCDFELLVLSRFWGKKQTRANVCNNTTSNHAILLRLLSIVSIPSFEGTFTLTWLTVFSLDTSFCELTSTYCAARIQKCAFLRLPCRVTYPQVLCHLQSRQRRLLRHYPRSPLSLKTTTPKPLQLSRNRIQISSQRPTLRRFSVWLRVHYRVLMHQQHDWREHKIWWTWYVLVTLPRTYVALTCFFLCVCMARRRDIGTKVLWQRILWKSNNTIIIRFMLCQGCNLYCREIGDILLVAFCMKQPEFPEVLL